MGLVQKEIEKEAAEKKPAAGYVDKERKGMPGLMDNEGQDQGSEGLKAAGQGTGCGRGDVLGRVMDAYRAARFQNSRVFRRGGQGPTDIFNANLTAEEIAAVQLLRAQKTAGDKEK